MNKEQYLPGKNKINYIFPIHITLKNVPSIVNGAQIVGTFRVEKVIKNYCYMIVEKDQHIIENISSSCIPTLNFQLKDVQKKKIKITSLVFFLNLSFFYSRNFLKIKDSRLW